MPGSSRRRYGSRNARRRESRRATKIQRVFRGYRVRSAMRSQPSAPVRRNTTAINKLMRKTFPICRYQITDTGVIEAQTHVKLLTQPNNWQECFRTYDVPGEDTPRSYDLSGLQVKWCCQCESAGSGNQWLQIFIVSLKPKTARKVLERTTNLSAMEKGVDYVATDMGSDEPVTLQGEGFYFLNPALYTTHYRSGVRRIGQSTMGADTAVTNIKDSTTRGHANVKFERTIKADEYHENGFRSVDAAHLETRNHLYFVMMSNATDTSGIFLTSNVLITGRQATSQ